MGSKVIGVIHW